MSVIGVKTKNGVNYSGISSYDDSQLRGLIDQKVTSLSGYSLVSDSQIARLSNVHNYNDEEIWNALSSSSANITQSVLTCQIPNDTNVQWLDVTIKLCESPDMLTNLIEISNITHHQIMYIAMDTQFISLSQYYDQNVVGTPKIPSSYFTGTLVVNLTPNSVSEFDPNKPLYAMAVWSNGVVSSSSQMIRFLYSGYCQMPRI